VTDLQRCSSCRQEIDAAHLAAVGRRP